MTCSTCMHSEPSTMEDGPVLECRRFPPTSVSINDDVVRLFTQVSGDEWCGEFRERVTSERTSIQVVHIKDRTTLRVGTITLDEAVLKHLEDFPSYLSPEIQDTREGRKVVALHLYSTGDGG